MLTPAQFDRIAGFRFLRLLGSGSFAHTYEAERDGERFAVKVFHDLPATAAAHERFRREVRSLRIEHPNLAGYVESGVAPHGGRQAAFIAMRYVPGMALRQRLADSPGGVGVPHALEIARGISAGLGCLHDHGIVHRDLKPANVYLPVAGGVTILDFGLARVQDLTTITARGTFVGTLAYCAPEQIRGEPDTHSDLYALGVILFEMLTGQIPFPSSNELELIQRITLEDPEPPVALDPSIPVWLDRLVLSLLAKEPLQRPRGAQAVLDALRDPPRHAANAVRTPYDRARPPLLVARATSGPPARAIVDIGLQGPAPDIAIASVTQPAQLDELHRARGLAGVPLAVDTRVLDTAAGAYRSIAALRGRPFLPTGPAPHTPSSLRTPNETQRVARGDIQEQIREGADVLRAPGFVIDSVESGWLRRNPRLLEAALAARNALAATMPLYAQVLCTIDVLADPGDRLSIVNRFARGDPDGYWVGVAGSEACAAEQLVTALDFMLMLQQIGVPCIWAVPGILAEMAWSVGIAGIEITLGRTGGFRPPTAAGAVRRSDHASRFDFPSLMTSLSRDLAGKALRSDSLPECGCACPSCRRHPSVEARLAHADEHNLWAWINLRDALAPLDAAQRLERYQLRLKAAAAQLATARKSAVELRSLRHVALAGRTLEIVLGDGILQTAARLRRAS